MKVHLKQIPPEGKHYEGEDPNTILDLSEPDITPLTPVAYALDVGLSDGGLFATGRLSCDLQLKCVGCLEKFVLPVRIDDFACQVELTGSEEIDLTEVLREDIVLALPPHPRCDWSGERVCPGIDRPASSPSSEAEEASRDIWGALDQLKLK
jgi:uncharacterized metal-binding protein YceD (DUF177 family)